MNRDILINEIINNRISFETIGEIYPVNQNVTITEGKIADQKCYWFSPKDPGESIISIYVHGGGFVMGNINTHRALVSHIAGATNTRILFIEYSLAPEHPFPTAIGEVIRVYEEILKVYPQNKIAFIGESAGRGLIVSVINALYENDFNIPNSAVLISSWLNLKCNTNSHKTRYALDATLNKRDILKYASLYAGSYENNGDPNELIFNYFPPVLIMVGSNEILFDDSKNFYDYIKAVQKETKFIEYENQGHVWMMTDIDSIESKQA
ncbi:MAG TPA: alpha/beta hydrolase fold domain-containing protein [Chitinophagaceae bacterium]|nr:alpha/beta hydrolase fold domain-containing protein [Chitinophagaceae bacterium]